MTANAVAVCPDATGPSACDGPAATALGGFDILAYPLVTNTAWVYSSPVAGCGSGATFKPVFELGASDYVFVYDNTSLASEGCLAASSITFGVGGLTPPFDVSQLDSTAVEEAFAAGFVLVGMFYALGKAVGAIMNVVKR